MLKKIKLKNFMSHKSSELELASGVNVLTGPNNSGKSAVVSALQMLTELPSKEGTYMIRHGETETQVIVETCDGNEIIWGRKKSSSYLIINGEKHTRLSNNQEHFLNELHKVLKLPQVQNKDETFDIHFASQKQPIFLLNEPPARAATFFSTSSDAGRLVEVRELFKTKIAKSKEKQKTLINKRLSLQQEIEKFAPLYDLEKVIIKLKTEFDDLTKQYDNINEGFKLLTAIKKYDQEHALLSLKFELITQVNQPPVVKNIVEIETTTSQIRTLMAEQKKLVKFHMVLANLMLHHPLEEIKDLSKTLQCIKNQKIEENNLSRKHKVLEKLEQKPLIADFLQLKDLIVLLINHSQAQNQKFCISHTLLQLSQPPVINDYYRLEAMVIDLRKTQNDLDRYHKKCKTVSQLDSPLITESSTQLEDHLKKYKLYKLQLQSCYEKSHTASSALQVWILEHPSCPTCGASLNTEHLSGAHHHG